MSSLSLQWPSRYEVNPRKISLLYVFISSFMARVLHDKAITVTSNLGPLPYIPNLVAKKSFFLLAVLFVLSVWHN